MDRPRILIADDHTLVAEAFKTLLEPEYQVVKLVADGRSLLTAAKELKPDVVLLELGMPLLNGLDTGQELKRSFPRIKLIILTMNEDPDVASKALRHWATGYLLKKSAGTELKKAKARNCASNRLSVKIPLTAATNGSLRAVMKPQAKNRHVTMMKALVTPLLVRCCTPGPLTEIERGNWQ